MNFFREIYSSVHPLLLLIIAFAIVAVTIIFRISRGVEIILFGLMFAMLGLMIYLVPPMVSRDETNEALRKKLLCLFVLSAVIVLIGEIIRV